MTFSPEQIQLIAEAASEKTVNKIFTALGVNINDPNEFPKIQRDFAHLRLWRENTEAIQRRGILTIVTVLVTAGLGWLLTYIFKWGTP
jgi:hypothetical protein